MLPSTKPIAAKQELLGVQALRGIAAWMVVMDHVNLWQTKYFPGPGPLPAATYTGEFGVDLFFVISGFIMMYVTPRAFHGWRDQGAFLVRRFLRIYPAYWAISLILLAIWLYNPRVLNNSQSNRLDLLSSFLLLPSSLFPILVVAWTLIFEIYFYCVASLIFYFSGAWRLALAALWFLIIVACNIAHPLPFSSPCLNIWLSTLSLEFIGGMFLAYFLLHAPLRIPPRVAGLVTLAFLFFAFYFGYRHGSYGLGPYSHWRLVVYGVPALVTLWMVLQMELQNQWGWLKKLVWLGDRSYSTYLFHVPVLAALMLLAARWKQHPSNLELALLDLFCVLILLVPVEVSYRLVEKPSHAFAKRLAASLLSARPRPDASAALKHDIS